jgi:hypothetical protein
MTAAPPSRLQKSAGTARLNSASEARERAQCQVECRCAARRRSGCRCAGARVRRRSRAHAAPCASGWLAGPPASPRCAPRARAFTRRAEGRTRGRSSCGGCRGAAPARRPARPRRRHVAPARCPHQRGLVGGELLPPLAELVEPPPDVLRVRQAEDAVVEVRALVTVVGVRLDLGLRRDGTHDAVGVAGLRGPPSAPGAACSAGDLTSRVAAPGGCACRRPARPPRSGSRTPGSSVGRTVRSRQCLPVVRLRLVRDRLCHLCHVELALDLPRAALRGLRHSPLTATPVFSSNQSTSANMSSRGPWARTFRPSAFRKISSRSSASSRNHPWAMSSHTTPSPGGTRPRNPGKWWMPVARRTQEARRRGGPPYSATGVGR